MDEDEVEEVDEERMWKRNVTGERMEWRRWKSYPYHE